jgi:protein phosphatase
VVRASGVSDVGRVRKTNEDTFVVDSVLQLYAVADGMGGHNAGEVASQLAIEALIAFIRVSVRDDDLTWPFGIDPSLSVDGNRLRTAIALANRRVFRAGETKEEYRGMGTTIVGVLVNGSHVAIGSVGDSRTYLLSEGALEQVTIDDSWAATVLAQDATLTAEDLARHPMRNVLTNVLGARESVDVRILERTLTAGDVLLLCTDGLHGQLKTGEMQRILESAVDVDQAPQRLIDAALSRGARDNVTAVVIQYDGRA